MTGVQTCALPILWQYQMPFRIAGIVLLTAGVYFRGGYSVEMTWRERVAEVEAQLKEAEQRSNELNDQLSDLAKKKTQIIRGRTEYITQYIDQNLKRYDNQCRIPQEFVKAHNDAARKPNTK